MSRLRTSLLACLASGMLLFEHRVAIAQYYSPYSAYPSSRERPYAEQRGIYVAPDGDDGYSEQPVGARPHRVAPNERDLGDYGPYSDPSAVPAPRNPPRRKARVAALPPDADPAYSTPIELDDEVDSNEATRGLVNDPTGQPAGTLTINTETRKLYLSLRDGQAIEYGIGVGREGFAWKGVAQVGRKAFWPGWTPPREMLLRRPDLPSHMDGGMENPLGARALYLFKGNKDTLFRIHGTNEPDTIGQAVSSGCIRMLNSDVIDLYRRVAKGARVVVL
jgi:lipoprotein-anchoring transpeptidase ErfK/SrfK